MRFTNMLMSSWTKDMYPAYRIQMSFKFRVMSESKSERDIKMKAYIMS